MAEYDPHCVRRRQDAPKDESREPGEAAAMPMPGHHPVPLVGAAWALDEIREAEWVGARHLRTA